MGKSNGKWLPVAFLAFLGAYITVEAYYAGQRDGQLVTSEDLPADVDEDDSSPKSQPEKGE